MFIDSGRFVENYWYLFLSLSGSLDSEKEKRTDQLHVKDYVS